MINLMYELLFETCNNYILFYAQKLSLLVTEAYKDAHQKSVQVRIPSFLHKEFSETLLPSLL
jgi:hypothetical protein